jgi:hypothetical protein
VFSQGVEHQSQTNELLAQHQNKKENESIGHMWIEYNGGVCVLDADRAV